MYSELEASLLYMLPCIKKKKKLVVWCMPGRGRRISESHASLVYKVSSSIVKTNTENPVSKNENKSQFYWLREEGSP